MVFDNRFAALQRIWREMPVECVKVRLPRPAAACLSCASTRMAFSMPIWPSSTFDANAFHTKDFYVARCWVLRALHIQKKRALACFCSVTGGSTRDP